MCYLTCPPTYYASNSTNCSLCKQGCATCVNIPTNCISCVTTGPDISFLLGSQCITSCPQPYYGATFPNVCTFCNAACQACTGPSINECQICMPGYKINNLTCSTTCLTGYGPTSNTLVCIWCNLKCASSSCTNVFDNCTSCTKTGPFTAYLATVGTSYPQCLSICPAGQYGNNTDQLCHMCDVSCVTCVNTSTKCLQCAGNAGWLNYACYNVCTNGYFLESNQVNSNNVNCAACYNCTLCEPVCETCTGTSTTCKSCPMTGVHAAYLLGNSCVGTCPNGYYNNNNGGLGPNLCTACFVGCQICAKSTTNCSLCAAGYFFFEFNCSLTCPTGYIGNIPTGTCLTQSIFSVNMTMKINFSD